MKRKGLITLGLVALLGVGVATSVGTKGFGAFAEHVHTGNHYTEKAAKAATSGIKEYWVCCECNEHYLEKPAGNWTEAGQANVTVDKTDDRYIARLLNENLDITVDDDTGEITINGYDNVDYDVNTETGEVTINAVDGDERFTYSVNEDGNVAIDGVKNMYDFRRDDDSGKYDVTIPDGVSEVNLKDAFKNKNIGTVTIPESVTDIGEGEDCMFYNMNDIDKVVYEGNGKDFLTNGMFANMIEACWKTYKDHSSRTQPYMPTEIVLDGVSYFTSSKVMGDFLTLNGKSSAGYVFYYRDAVPTKMTTAKGKSYSIDICGKDTKKLNAAFGRDNHETFINEANL